MDTKDLPEEPTRRELLALLPLLGLSTLASAQDVTKVRADSYRVAFENSRLRVLEFISRPGMGICGRGMHSHPPHLTVTLTPGRARVRRPDGTVRDQPTMPAGTVFWSEAETHEVENIGGRDVRALLIELKG